MSKFNLKATWLRKDGRAITRVEQITKLDDISDTTAIRQINEAIWKDYLTNNSPDDVGAFFLAITSPAK